MYYVLIVLYVYILCLNSDTCDTNGILRKSVYFGYSDLIYILICKHKLLMKKNALQKIYLVKASFIIFYEVQFLFLQLTLVQIFTLLWRETHCEQYLMQQ